MTDVKNGVYEQIKANPDLKLPDQFQQVGLCGGGVWVVVWFGVSGTGRKVGWWPSD